MRIPDLQGNKKFGCPKFQTTAKTCNCTSCSQTVSPMLPPGEYKQPIPLLARFFWFLDICIDVCCICQCAMELQSQEQFTCVGCGELILDQYVLRVAPDMEWHARCLRCTDCQQLLDETCTCFVRNGCVYCKPDYIR